jgi:hypothetical protein
MNTATVAAMSEYDFGPSGPPVMARQQTTMNITVPSAARMRAVLFTRFLLEDGSPADVPWSMARDGALT